MKALGHRAAQDVFRELVAGIEVEPDRLEAALSHAEACDRCRRLFDVGPSSACEGIEDELAGALGVLREGGNLAESHPAVARHIAGCVRCALLVAELMHEPTEPSLLTGPPVDPPALFERALAGALLEEPEELVRARVAEHLGSMERLGAQTLGVLAEAVGDDKEIVRKAAIKALDRLDTNVTIPQRLIEEWADDPDKASSFIAGVLNRFAQSPIPSVIGLKARKSRSQRELAVSSAEGITGRLSTEGGNIWLRLGSLPGYFEHLRPVVAFPKALDEDAPMIEWAGRQPGLVTSQDPVAGGSVDVLVGSGEGPESGPLFKDMYLLAPQMHSRA